MVRQACCGMRPRRDLSPRRLFEILCCPLKSKLTRSVVAVLARLPRWRCCLRSAAGARRAVRRARCTRTARPGAICSTATWYRRSDPRDRGLKAGLPARRAPLRRLAGRHGARRRQRRRHVGAQLPRRRALVPQGLRGARRGGDQLGAALRVGELPRHGVAERAAARAATRGGYLPFELEAKGVRRGTNRLVVRVDSRRTEAAIPPLGVRDGRQVRRRLVELRRHPARGLPAPGRHVRLRRTCFVRPRLDCPTCDARIYVRAVVANMEGVPARRRADRPPSAGKRIRVHAAPRSRHAASTCSAAARRSRSRGCGAPTDPHLYTVELEVELDGQVVQRYTQRTGIRSIERDEQRPDAAERPAPDAARGEHARGGPGARRRAATRRDPRELRPAARPGRQHDALALPDAPARARAGGPLRHRGVVRGPGLPDARRAVPQLRRAPARGAAGARHGEPRPQPSLGDRVEPRQREHLEARRRLHALPDGCGAARARGSTRRGSWASPSPAIRRSASRSSTRSSTRWA